MRARYLTDAQLKECIEAARRGSTIATADLRLALDELNELRLKRDAADARVLARLGIPIPRRQA